MFDLRRWATLLLLIATSVMAGAAAADQAAPQGSAASGSATVTVGSGIDINPFSADAFVLIGLSGGQWQVANISGRPPKITDPATQELLVVGRSFSVAEPYFRDYYSYEKTKGSDPRKPAPFDPYVCFTGETAKRPQYNPCDSKLTYTSDRGKSLLGNLMMILEADPATLRLGRGYAVTVDREKVQAVLAETNAIDAAKRYARQARFEKADTVEKVQAFVERYKDDDPEGLVPRAEARIPVIQKAEREKQLAQYRAHFQAARTSAEFRAFMEQYASDDPDRLIPKAALGLKQTEADERRQAADRVERARKAAAVEADRRRREAAALATWRTHLKVGDDTFCGPAIEIRQPMIKIAVRAQLPGYASEAWLKSSEIFPPNVGCRNINGELLPAEYATRD